MKSLIKKIYSPFWEQPDFVRYPKGDFLKHLIYVNPGFLHDGNLECSDHAISSIVPDSIILEIGSLLFRRNS